METTLTPPPRDPRRSPAVGDILIARNGDHRRVLSVSGGAVTYEFRYEDSSHWKTMRPIPLAAWRNAAAEWTPEEKQI